LTFYNEYAGHIGIVSFVSPEKITLCIKYYDNLDSVQKGAYTLEIVHAAAVLLEPYSEKCDKCDIELVIRLSLDNCAACREAYFEYISNLSYEELIQYYTEPENQQILRIMNCMRINNPHE
jgi:hypothetical protein